MQRNGQGLGERREVRPETVRHRHQGHFLQQHALGIATVELTVVSGKVHAAGRLQERLRHDARAGLELSVAARTVVDDLAAELMPEHYGILCGREDLAVAHARHQFVHVGEVVTHVQVRAADAATQNAHQDLAVAGNGFRQVPDVQFRVLADDSFHRGVSGAGASGSPVSLRGSAFATQGRGPRVI